MTTLDTLWLQTQERLAAQAWSLTDDTWFASGEPTTAARLLSTWAHTEANDRLGTARALQQASDNRSMPAGDLGSAIATAWRDLRWIDYELGRNFTDLRSDVATYMCDRAVSILSHGCAASGVDVELTITGPGLLRAVTLGAGAPSARVQLSWPVLIEYCCGLQLPDFVDVDITTADGSEESVRRVFDELATAILQP